MSDDAACEVCGARPAFDTLAAWLCLLCIETQASMAPEVLEYQAKKFPPGSRERVSLRVVANWLRRCRLQPRARQ